MIAQPQTLTNSTRRVKREANYIIRLRLIENACCATLRHCDLTTFHQSLGPIIDPTFNTIEVKLWLWRFCDHIMIYLSTARACCNSDDVLELQDKIIYLFLI